MANRALLLATTSARVRLGPNAERRSVKEGAQVTWEWPLRDGEPGYDVNQLPPRNWIIMNSNVDEEEWSKRVEIASRKPVDRSEGRQKDEMNVERGFSQADMQLIKNGVNLLDDDEPLHWTKLGLPSIEQVQTKVEGLIFADTGDREFPTWVSRKTIENCIGRKRDDGEG